MAQTGKLMKVYVYLRGKRIEIEPDEARALLAQLKAALGEQTAAPVYIPWPTPMPPPMQPIPLPSQPLDFPWPQIIC